MIANVKAETSCIDPSEIKRESTLTDMPLAMDSLEFVHMVIGLEEEFGFIADDEDFVISSMKTVDDVVKIVLARL